MAFIKVLFCSLPLYVCQGLGRSLRGVAPVDRQVHTSYPLRILARQKHRNARNIIWQARSAKGMECIKILSRDKIGGRVDENSCSDNWYGQFHLPNCDMGTYSPG